MKQFRKAIGADLVRMAEILGLNPADGESISRMENGTQPITDPVQQALKANIGIWRAAQKVGLTPKFLIGSDMDRDKGARWIVHTEHPRFLAVVTDEPIEGLVCVTVDSKDWLAVTTWIDQPAGDPMKCLKHAAEQYLFHSLFS